jgi:hypothetical protein
VHDVVIGNVHLNVLSSTSQPRVVDHVPDHDKGKRYVAALFAERGCIADFVYLDNAAEKHDRYAVKVFKHVQKREV